jgi:predicted phosphodiesterase
LGTELTWLHLSDLHIRGPFEGSHHDLWEDSFGKLIDDIETCVEKFELTADAVFFTGDITFSGAPREFERAEQVLDRILEAAGLPEQRGKLFVVPGNHDVYWKDVSNLCRRQRDEWVESEGDYREIEELLGNPKERAIFAKGLTNYANFFHDYRDDDDWMELFEAGKDYYVEKVQVGDEHSIAVVGLNSALCSYKGHDQGRLFIGKSTVVRALTREVEEKVPGASLRFILVHHPLYWLAEVEIRELTPILAECCNMILHGHLHYSQSYLLKTPDRILNSWATGSSFESSWSVNAYNFGQLDPGTGKGRIIMRVRDPRVGEWRPDKILYRRAPRGVLSISLRPRSDRRGGVVR